MKSIRIGTRGSQLALYQAGLVKNVITAAMPAMAVEIVIIKTKGDKILDVALSKIGDKGLFTKELELALLRNEIDIAVHSLKDIPTSLPGGLLLGAVTEREDRRDALVSRNKKRLEELTPVDTVATSSLRRRASLLRYNNNLKIIDIRGNINARIQKMESGHCDAMIMALAGLKRMGLEHHVTEILSPDRFMPAVSQGALGLETRAGDRHINSFLEKINHRPTWTSIIAERAFMRTLEGGCLVPVGCFTVLDKTDLSLSGFVSSTDGKEYIEDEIAGKASDPEKLGTDLAEKLLKRGGDKILAGIRNS